MPKALRQNDIKSLTDIEHVLLRPQMYAGSNTEDIYPTYIYENNKIVLKDILLIPALLKLFDEIISNSLDEAIRTKFKYGTKIKVSYEEFGQVTIEDNGRGLPIELDATLKKWTPEIIYTHLRAGSNFDDENKEMLVGQFGVGGSLVPIFSNKFTIDTANGNKKYTQEYKNHLSIIKKPFITDSKDNYTSISYTPDYSYFNVSDTVAENLKVLYEKRVRDLAFAYPEVTFWFNKEKIAVPKLKQFVESIHPIYECNEVENGRVAIFYSDTEFQQLSIVNGANTSRGGTHVDYATNKIVEHVRAFLKKKHKLEVKPIDIKTKIFLLLSIRMQNPAFDSQTKEKMISSNNFKALIDDLLSEKFLNSILKNEEIILPIVESYKLKMQVKDNIDLKKLGQQKKKVRIDKYYPATRYKKYLVLTEGDSAQNGLMSVLGREVFSYFPLKGKPLNVLEAKIDKIKTNDEIKNIVQILNLRLDKDIQDDIVYENILFGTDQDNDGLAIRGLLLTFFYKFAPSLLKANRVKFIRTPLLAGFDKKGKIKDFYFTMAEYNKGKNPDYKYSYYKGLSGWESSHLSELIALKGLSYFIQDYEYDEESEQTILNWMSSSTVEYRKEQLRNIEFDINSL